MSGQDKIASSIIGTVLCLSILALPPASFGLTDSIQGSGGGGDREEWHGPGDPEGGDRYSGDLIYFELQTGGQGAVESLDRRGPREAVPSIRLIRFGYDVLLVIEAEDERKTRIILLSR